MSDRTKLIVDSINLDSESAIEKALDQSEEFSDLTDEEKVELATAFTTLFYHDFADKIGMIKLANRAEKLVGSFGQPVVPSLITELKEADAESASRIGRAIARNGEVAVGHLMGAIDANRSDDYAIINIIQTLAYFKDPEVLKAIPEILVAVKSKNPQVRSMALYATGRLAKNLGSDLFDEKLRIKMFDTAIEALATTASYVRRNATRALGKMLKKDILNAAQKDKVFKAFNAILGNDDEHEWDRNYMVRHEAEHFIPLCKAGGGKLADKYRQSFRIVAKRELCPQTYHFKIEAPLLAKKMLAGQFVIVRNNDHGERIPLSVCGWDTNDGTIHIIVMAAGKTSGEITKMNVGDCLADIVGPLGERSHVKKHEGTCVVIGGGYGTGAVIPTARDFKELGNRTIGIVGARMESLLIMVPELKEVCDEVMLTTNDGSAGIQGFVTHALEEIIKRGEKVSHVLAVGPVPMMIAVANMTKPLGIETYVSLNAIMVDGTGMCGACRVSVGGETKFACFHGPDFDGHKVDFNQLMLRQKMFVSEEKAALAAIES